MKRASVKVGLVQMSMSLEKTENVAKGYAGVYGIWLKKTAKGWNFVFNQKPDVWGTMYDPAANVGEVPVETLEAWRR